jgi:hypothetical protein
VKWTGLFSNYDRSEVPPGGAQAQTNCTCIRPGQIASRPGLITLSVAAANVTTLFRCSLPGGDGLVIENANGGVSLLGTDGQQTIIEQESSYSSPSSFAETRLTWIMRINGQGRGTLYKPAGNLLYPLGITVPAVAPTATAGGAGNTYPGTYSLGYRFLDADGIASCLSPLAAVTAGAGEGFSWTAIPQPTDADSGGNLRCTQIQLYRSLVDLPAVLYLVATLPVGTLAWQENAVTDEQLMLQAALPILYSNGGLCARRQVPPPTDMPALCQFQDRMFFLGYDGTDTARRNLLVYSEPDEPESVPDSQNALIIRDDTDDPDEVVGAVSRGPIMLLMKQRHAYQFSFVLDPRFDGNLVLACGRGAVNARCYAVYVDTVYALDERGPWRMGGSGAEDLSGPIRDYFRDQVIDWTWSDLFFVSIDPHQMVVRFHVALLSDTEGNAPSGYEGLLTALCFSIDQQAWWVENYAGTVTCTGHFTTDGRLRTLLGGPYGVFLTDEGVLDQQQLGNSGIEQAVTWSYLSGMMQLQETQVGDLELDVRVGFEPTNGAETFTIRIYVGYEADPATLLAAARTWYPYSQGPISMKADSPDITVNMQRQRTPLAQEAGWARVPLKLRADPKVLSNRWIAVEMTGTPKAEEHAIHVLQIMPAGGVPGQVGG